MLKYLLLSMAMSPLLAEGGPDHGEASFMIESIRLTNIRHVSREIIISESRLEEGQVYSEKQLKNAVGRILRLPFVLDVNFSLEKGSRKGHYVLVINIKETSLFFYNLSTERQHNDTASGDSTNRVFEVGARWFIGTSGVIYASYAPQEDHFSDPTIYRVGYSQYNLFDRNIFLNFTLTVVDQDNRSFNSFLGPTLETENDDLHNLQMDLSVPIGNNQWIKAFLAHSEQDSEQRIIEDDDVQSRNFMSEGNSATLLWEFNTNNDNFLPTEGTLFQVGATLLDYTGSGLRLVDETYVMDAHETEEKALFLDYRRRHEFSPRQSWSYGGDFQYRKVDREWEENPGIFDSYYNRELTRTRLHVGYSVDLWGRKRTRKYGDFRFLLDGWLTHFDEERDLFGDYGDYRIEFAFTYRTKWGVISLRGGYVDE